ncbi:retrotransposable element Tf2 [Tanacetum coccineum]
MTFSILKNKPYGANDYSICNMVGQIMQRRIEERRIAEDQAVRHKSNKLQETVKKRARARTREFRRVQKSDQKLKQKPKSQAQSKENVIQVLKFHLQRSQNRMKQQADKSRVERQFEFYGPFEISAKVGQVAYKLKLHAQAQIHNVFHVSQLKKYKGPPLTEESIMLLQCDKEGFILVQPVKLLDRRMAKKGNIAMVYGLVQWANGTVDDASWEELEKLVKDFPDFGVRS